MADQDTAQALSARWVPARLFPGIGLCILVTAVAYLLQAIEIDLVGRPWLEALVFAIILGVVVRSFWTPPTIWRAVSSSAPRQCSKSRWCCSEPR